MTDRPPPLIALAAGTLVFGAALFGAAGGALAQAQPPAPVGPTAVGEFKSWSAFTASPKPGKVCFTLSPPQKPRSSRRSTQPPPDGANFFITNRPQEGVFNEVSLVPGMPLKPASDVELTVDGATFKLYVGTDGAGAFMGNAEDQKALVQAMRGARRDMSVKATPKNGRAATQSYSLAGLGAALDKINQECRGATPARAR